MNGAAAGCLGFKIETLNKLIDTKTADNQSTLLHYLVTLIQAKYPDLVNLSQEFPSVESASKVSTSALISNISEMKIQLRGLLAVVDNVKPAPKDDQFKELIPPVFKTWTPRVEELNIEFEKMTNDFTALEESFRGSSDSAPEEFFQQFYKFLENLHRVRTDLEMEKVRKQREEHKEKKTQSALLSEIQKGVKLRATKKENPKEIAKKKGSHIGKAKALPEMAEMGNIAAQIARRNQERAKSKKPQTTAPRESRLDRILDELS